MHVRLSAVTLRIRRDTCNRSGACPPTTGAFLGTPRTATGAPTFGCEADGDLTINGDCRGVNASLVHTVESIQPGGHPLGRLTPWESLTVTVQPRGSFQRELSHNFLSSAIVFGAV